MKTSVVASLLFGSLAAAVPLNKRAYITKTNVVVETVVVYTTVWDGEAVTSSPGRFYEQTDDNSQPTSSVYAPSANTQPTSPSTPEAPASTSSSSVYTPPPPPPPTPAPAPEEEQKHQQQKQQQHQKQPQQKQQQQKQPEKKPASTKVAPPAPAAPSKAPSSGGGSGKVHSGGSITMNKFQGGTGSCGKPIQDTDMAVALAADLYGESTYNSATGEPTSKWCNMKVAITYKGSTTDAVIMDRCVGCTDGGFDMTPALWKAVTGGAGGDSGDRLYGATWQEMS